MKLSIIKYNTDMVYETWKDIKGYEGYYMVSDMGRIKSLPRLIESGMNYKSVRFTKESIIKTVDNGKGYLRCNIYKNGKMKTVKIHRLVAESFIGIDNPDFVVNHINGIKTDNRLSNIEVVTQKDNVKHAWKTGLAKRKKTKKVIQLNISGDFIRKWDSAEDASRSLFHKKSSASKIRRNCRGAIKSYMGYKWRYV